MGRIKYEYSSIKLYIVKVDDQNEVEYGVEKKSSSEKDIVIEIEDLEKG
jgi:hypothetical protein